METFAKLSKYLANRKATYEKDLASPIEAERNTAHLMIDRINRRTDELFDFQESSKIPEPGNRMFFKGGETEDDSFWSILTRGMDRTMGNIANSNLPNSHRRMMEKPGITNLTQPRTLDSITGAGQETFPTWFKRNYPTGGFKLYDPASYVPKDQGIVGPPMYDIPEVPPAPVTQTPRSTVPVPAAVQIPDNPGYQQMPNTFHTPSRNRFTPRQNWEDYMNNHGLKTVETPTINTEFPSHTPVQRENFLKRMGKFAQEFGPTLGMDLMGFAATNAGIGKLQEPESPIYNPPVQLNKALDTGAEENMVRRAVRTRQMNAERYAPNSQALMGEFGRSTAEGMNALGMIEQKKGQHAAQMENVQAGMNQENTMRNVMMSNQYMEDLVNFKNNKQNAKTNNIINLLNKFGLRIHEGKMREHDLKKAEILMKQFPEDVQKELRDFLDKFKTSTQTKNNSNG